MNEGRIEQAKQTAFNLKAMGMSDESIAMAVEFGVSVVRERFDEVSMASRLHDIGKLAIPASVLDKSGGLSEEEYRLVKCHTVYGYLLLKSMGYLPAICEAVRDHHERYDGRGYGGSQEPWHCRRQEPDGKSFRPIITDNHLQIGIPFVRLL